MTNHLNISSVGGRIGLPAYSLYSGTKFFVEGFSECLSYEVSGFGIKVKLVEPGSIKTDFQSRSMEFLGDENYKDFMKKMKAITKKSHEKAQDPQVVAKTIYKAATDKSNKLRYPSGRGAATLLKIRKLLPEGFFSFIVRKVVL